MDQAITLEITEDAQLLQDIVLGNQVAFSTLYDRHAGLVFSVALRMMSDREEARDVVQQVFLKVLQKAKLYCPTMGRVVSWLCMITRNQCLDRLRQVKSRKTLGENFIAESLSNQYYDNQPLRYGHYHDEVELLNGAISVLRPQEAEVLQMAYFTGLSQKEIADKLCVPLGSVKARIRRSLVKLRNALEGVIHPVGQPAALSSMEVLRAGDCIVLLATPQR